LHLGLPIHDKHTRTRARILATPRISCLRPGSFCDR
jgi:hypothetical protein